MASLARFIPLGGSNNYNFSKYSPLPNKYSADKYFRVVGAIFGALFAVPELGWV